MAFTNLPLRHFLRFEVSGLRVPVRGCSGFRVPLRVWGWDVSACFAVLWFRVAGFSGRAGVRVCFRV